MTDTLFITDLDGTLLQPDVTVSETSRRILTRLLENGLQLSVATARTSFSVLPILKGLPLRLPLILQNGAVLHDPVQNRIVRAAVIEDDAFLRVCALYRDMGINGFVFCVPEDQLLCCYSALTTPHMREYFDTHRKPFYQTQTLDTLTALHPVFLSVNAPKERLDPVHAALQQIDGICTAYYKDVYRPEIWYLEITAPEATKYHGILYLKEMTGAKKTVGFGDNLNDLPLFRACDLKIAVGNAADALKDCADLVIGRNTEDAVAEKLQNLFSNS